LVKTSHQLQNIVAETNKVLSVLHRLHMPRYVDSSKTEKEHLSIELLTCLKKQISCLYTPFQTNRKMRGRERGRDGAPEFFRTVNMYFDAERVLKFRSCGDTDWNKKPKIENPERRCICC
jgi:hypothetical protein